LTQAAKIPGLSDNHPFRAEQICPAAAGYHAAA